MWAFLLQPRRGWFLCKGKCSKRRPSGRQHPLHAPTSALLRSSHVTFELWNPSYLP